MARFSKTIGGRRMAALFYSPLSLIALGAVVVFLGHSVWGLYTKERESGAALIKASDDLADLTARQKKLENENSDLETDRGIEGQIRSKYSVSKPNEEVYVVVDDHNASSSNQATTTSGFWGGIKSFFSR